MPAKVALAGFHIESVSALSRETTYDDFEKETFRGREIVDRLQGSNTVLGGILESCHQEGLEPDPIVFASKGALGPASDEAVERYTGEIAAGLAERRGEIGGVILVLHGAAVSPTHLDPEREIIAAARSAVGDGLPIMVAFDYHANLDQATIAPATAVFGYQRSPHTDMAETGQRAVRCLARTIEGKIRPVFHLAKPGVMVPSIFSATDLMPLAGILARAREMEKAAPGFLDISVLAGFSYADAPNTGFSVVAVSDDRPDEAREAARSLSRMIWDERRRLYRARKVYSVKEAVDSVTARAAGSAKPFVLLEHADRMTDSTYVLEELINRRVKKAYVPFLWDAEAAARAAGAGAGNRVDLLVGAHTSERAGRRLAVEALVLEAGPQKYRISGPMMHGLEQDLGLTALVDIEGVQVSLVSRPSLGVDLDVFNVFGLDIGRYEVIVLRSKTHFRAVFEPLAEEILIVDTPDYGPADLTKINYRHAPINTIYPFCEG